MANDSKSLGREIKRLRIAADMTLRAFAEQLGVSAAHVSDIEHDRRRPSEDLLRRIASELKPVGADLEALKNLDTRPDPETQEWMAENPGVSQLLRTVRQSGKPLDEVIAEFEKTLKKSKKDRP